MYPISDALRARFEAGERKSAKVTLNNADVVDLLITEADIVSDTLSIDRYCTTGSKIEVGSAVSAELSLVLNNSNGKFDEVTFEGAELKVEIGINGVTDSYIPCGYFTVDEPPRAFSRISLKALDFMMRYDKRADLSLLPFPCNAETLVRAISDICDVEVSEDIDFDSFPNSQETLYAPTSADITYRQILQWVAQITGTCAYIDWNGKLMLSWFESTDVNITPALRYSGDVLENDIEITGVVVKTQSESYVSGTEEYPLDVDGNELIYNGTEQYKADNILNAVSGFKYRPYECSCMPMPYLYPLDRIAYTDKKGNKISTVITNHTFGLNNVSSIAAQGETKQKKSYALQKSITKKEVNAAIKEALNDFDSSAEHVYVKYSPYNGGKDSEGNVVWNDSSDDTTVYIGICATSEKTAPADPTEYKWSRVRGADGYTPVKDKDYFDGDDGRGVSKVETWYYLSTSGTALVGGSWSTSAPTWTDGTYLWTKLVTTYTDSKTEESAAVVDASWKKTSAVETAAEDLSKTLAGALGLHSTPLTVNGATIWYYHTNPVLTDSEEGDTILVWNGAGVGVCKSGWVANGNLDFTYGATFDGKAVWDILVANNISADNIEAGVVKSIETADIQTQLNLNDGTLNFDTDTTSVNVQAAITGIDGTNTGAGFVITDKINKSVFHITPQEVTFITAEYIKAVVDFLFSRGEKPADPYFSQIKPHSVKTKDIHCQNIYVLNQDKNVEEDIIKIILDIKTEVDNQNVTLSSLENNFKVLEAEVARIKEIVDTKSLVVYASANPSTAGIVEGSGSYDLEDESFLITAYPASGTEYYISSVIVTYSSDGSSQTFDQATLINRNWLTNANTRLDMPVDITASRLGDTANVVVNFGLPTKYNLTLNADPTGSGTVTGSGSYYPDTQVTISATANSGYEFVGWYENGSLIFSDAEVTIAMIRDRILTAKFEAVSVTKYYTITLLANPTNGGTVSGGGTYAEDTTVSIKATANSGYEFEGWYDESGELIRTTSSTLILANSDKVLTARFKSTASVAGTKVIVVNGSNSASLGDEVYLSSNEQGTDNLGTDIVLDSNDSNIYLIAKSGSGRKVSYVEKYITNATADNELGSTVQINQSGLYSLSWGYKGENQTDRFVFYFEQDSGGGDTGYAEDTIVDGVLYIGTNTTEIADLAYYSNEIITSVIIPSGVTKIGKYAFSSCPSLVSVEISDTVTSIDDAAFRWCPELETVTIGSGLTRINVDAFYGCDKLSDVYYSGTQEQWNSIENYDTTITKATIHYNS